MSMISYSFEQLVKIIEVLVIRNNSLNMMKWSIRPGLDQNYHKALKAFFGFDHADRI